jgi:hypothetical protein
MIKGIIDLHRGEASRIEAKHFLGRDFFRIEFPFPFLVPIPAGADKDFHMSLFQKSFLCALCVSAVEKN